jgi:hypothetical protein
MLIFATLVLLAVGALALAWAMCIAASRADYKLKRLTREEERRRALRQGNGLVARSQRTDSEALTREETRR